MFCNIGGKSSVLLPFTQTGKTKNAFRLLLIFFIPIEVAKRSFPANTYFQMAEENKMTLFFFFMLLRKA